MDSFLDKILSSKVDVERPRFRIMVFDVKRQKRRKSVRMYCRRTNKEFIYQTIT